MGLISEERRVKSEERMEQLAYRNLIVYQKGKEVVMQTYVERDGQPR